MRLQCTFFLLTNMEISSVNRIRKRTKLVDRLKAMLNKPETKTLSETKPNNSNWLTTKPQLLFHFVLYSLFKYVYRAQPQIISLLFLLLLLNEIKIPYAFLIISNGTERIASSGTATTKSDCYTLFIAMIIRTVEVKCKSFKEVNKNELGKECVCVDCKQHTFACAERPTNKLKSVKKTEPF